KAQAARAWKLAYLREPSEKELAGALAFLAAAADAFRNQPAPAAAPPKKGEKAPEPPSAAARALAAFCQALLASNRLLYVDCVHPPCTRSRAATSCTPAPSA